MLFNSVFFITVFLPFSLFFYFLIAKFSQRFAIYTLIFFSLIFYGWHTPKSLLLIGFSLGINYLFLSYLTRTGKKSVLVLGIIFNVAVISYFKYKNFFISNVNSMFDYNFEIKDIVLPLAISFFTFQKIAFLIDTYRKQAELPSFTRYCTFVMFFPQLIAGPILRHSDFLPQLENPAIYRPIPSNLAVGTTIFILGLFKKTIFADSFASFSDLVFHYSQNQIPSLFEAWLGIFAFSLQIYFDFSGYSDMALGLARMFNFKFPMNFNSPYKAINIIDFWRRWHISLSFFLRDYLYISLGGNRKGGVRRYFNLLITMLIGGLWHGASWTFVCWGGLHGVYLVLNHLAQSFYTPRSNIWITQCKKGMTFLIVTLTWVFFRASTFQSAKLFFCGLAGFNGLGARVCESKGFLYAPFAMICLGILVCFTIPNTYEWLIKYRPTLNNLELWKTNSFARKNNLIWRPTWIYLAFVLIIFFIAFGNIEHAHEFIYFQF